MKGRKDKKDMRKDAAADKIKAFLGTGSQFEGTLVFEDIVRMDGSFSGKITSKDTLIVGETAHIEADITVGTLILSGRFKGQITANLRVELRAPAQVEGAINTPSLVVEEGVLLNSTVTMGQAQPLSTASITD
jgi:cytoskeletal protein CcmA (bactofilin family)